MHKISIALHIAAPLMLVLLEPVVFMIFIFWHVGPKGKRTKQAT